MCIRPLTTSVSAFLLPWDSTFVIVVVISFNIMIIITVLKYQSFTESLFSINLFKDL